MREVAQKEKGKCTRGRGLILTFVRSVSHCMGPLEGCALKVDTIPRIDDWDRSYLITLIRDSHFEKHTTRLHPPLDLISSAESNLVICLVLILNALGVPLTSIQYK